MTQFALLPSPEPALLLQLVRHDFHITVFDSVSPIIAFHTTLPFKINNLTPRYLDPSAIIGPGELTPSKSHPRAPALAQKPIYQTNPFFLPTRSEERRVGKECRSRWSP